MQIKGNLRNVLQALKAEHKVRDIPGLSTLVSILVLKGWKYEISYQGPFSALSLGPYLTFLNCFLKDEGMVTTVLLRTLTKPANDLPIFLAEE
jgi:hypothetical protein